MTGVLVDTCTSESSFGVIKVNKKITLKQMNEAIRQIDGRARENASGDSRFPGFGRQDLVDAAHAASPRRLYAPPIPRGPERHYRAIFRFSVKQGLFM